MKAVKAFNNSEISSLLKKVATAYELEGENTFRIKAYENAADSVERANREIKDIWEDDKIDELPGIGPNISSHLTELFTTGKVKHFNQLFNKFPKAIFTLTEIPGIGAKTAEKLVKKLNIISEKQVVSLLRSEALNGKISKIQGFGEDSEKAIIRGIEEYLRREKRMLLTQATQISDDMVSFLKKNSKSIRVDTLGSLRRHSATIGDIDIAVCTNHPEEIMKHLKRYKKISKIVAIGTNTARIIHESGRQIDIKTQSEERYGSMLQHFTGSKSHNIHLRELALEKKWSLSEHGIKKGQKIIKFSKEEDFYAYLGLQWIPPELREDQGEIEAAGLKKIPTLVSQEEIRGDLHVHSNPGWVSSHDSGQANLSEIAAKALSLGYEYLAVADHNPSLNAYSEQQIISLLKKRKRVFEQYNDSNKYIDNKRTIRLFNILEVDLKTNGSLAVSDDVLQYLDFIVVSIHSSMRLSKDNMTERIIKGLKHPKAKILGHPTGRILNKREGYEFDWEKILNFCNTNHKILEVNAWPSRLDLPDSLIHSAVNKGVKLAINTDAHALEHMDNMSYGVYTARRGWAEKKHVINTLPLKKIEKLLIS